MEARWPVNADQSYRSHLFTLRLWVEPSAAHPEQMRFRVHHVPSGEVRYFRDWSALTQFVLAIVGASDGDPPHRHWPDEL